MEIKPAAAGGYAGQLPGQTRQTEGQPAKKTSAQIVTDYIQISQEAREKLKQKEPKIFDRDWIKSQMESARAEAEAAGKSLETVGKCNEIIKNIIAGKRVPPEDLQYLMEKDGEGFRLAMAMRRLDPDPEDAERVSEEEEEENGGGTEAAAGAEGGTAPAPEVSAPAAEAAPVE